MMSNNTSLFKIFFDQNITTKEAQSKLQKVAKVMLMEA